MALTSSSIFSTSHFLLTEHFPEGAIYLQIGCSLNVFFCFSTLQFYFIFTYMFTLRPESSIASSPKTSWLPKVGVASCFASPKHLADKFMEPLMKKLFLHASISSMNLWAILGKCRYFKPLKFFLSFLRRTGNMGFD